MIKTLFNNKVIISVFISGIVFTAVVFLVFKIVYVEGAGPLENETLVTIPEGSSVSRASSILANENIISYGANKWHLFKVAYYVFFTGESVKAGEYRFAPGISTKQVLKKLTSGDINYRKLTIPEGFTTNEILQNVSGAEGLVGEVPGDINEGELLPETYLYTSGESRKDFIKRMYVKRYQALEALWANRSRDVPLKSKEEAIIAASIVEKETSIAEERKIVASVYLNRLKKGMKLQADPTVVYAITLGEKNLDRELTNKDLKINSKYNTYRYKGLPPGPICNPGEASIEAVLHPADTDFLYFVADGNGGHNFAKNATEHNRNVRNYRILKRKEKLAGSP